MKECVICHATAQSKARTCVACAKKIEAEARVWQERDYLARWLSTRDNDSSAVTQRLRTQALHDDIDWRDTPPPMAFAERLAVLTDSYAKQAA